MSSLVVFAVIGIAAGLRAMTPLAAVAWGARLQAFAIAEPALGWLGHPVAVAVVTVLALGELVTDQLPRTPSRTVPVQFGTRIVVGALCGAALAGGATWVGAVVGAIGAVAGTLGGHAARARLAAAFGRDLPAALLEDAVAIGLALLVVFALVPALR